MPKFLHHDFVAMAVGYGVLSGDDSDKASDDIVELLTRVWNARGAADIQAISDQFEFNPYVSREAIRSLDR